MVRDLARIWRRVVRWLERRRPLDVGNATDVQRRLDARRAERRTLRRPMG